MADETLLLQLDIGGESGDAQEALSQVGDSLGNLQTALDQINGASLESVGAAASGAQGDLQGVGEAGEAAASGAREAGSGAEEAEGGFHGMGSAAGDLVGELGGANSSLGEMTAHVTEIAGGLGALATGPAGIAALGAIGVGVFTALGTKAGEWAQEMMRLMAVTGMNKEEAEKWKIAMEIVGGSIGSLEKAAFKLQGALETANQEMAAGGEKSKTTAILVDTLGISLMNAEGNTRTFAEIFPEVIARLAGMEDGTQRNATAADLFGRRMAINLIPLLEHYTDVMPEATRLTKEYGEGMDDPEKASIEFGIAQAELNEQMEELYTKVGPPFLAFLTGLAKTINLVTGAIGDVNDGLNFLGTSLGDVISSAPGLSVIRAGLDFKDILSGDTAKIDDFAEHLTGTTIPVEIAKGAITSLGDEIGGWFGGGGEADVAILNINDDMEIMRDQMTAVQLSATVNMGIAKGWMTDTAAEVGQLQRRGEELAASAAFDDFRKDVEDSMKGSETAIQGVLPTVDEEFGKWQERLHTMATDYANFQGNLQAILDSLVAAHVKTPELIIGELEKAGPGVTAAMAKNLAQGGVDAVRTTLGDLSTVVGTNIEAATGEVLKQTPAWKAQFDAIGDAAVQGTIEGFLREREKLYGVITETGDQMSGSLKQALDVRSPSGVFAEIGENVTLGLAQGLTSADAMAALDRGNALLANHILDQIALLPDEMGLAWGNAFDTTWDHLDLASKAGSQGAGLVDALWKAIADGTPQAVTQVGKLAADIVYKLRSQLPDDGQQLGTALTDALSLAIETGSPDAVAAVTKLLEQIQTEIDQAKEPLKITMDNFTSAITDVLNDKALLDEVGKDGVRLMDALDAALKQGGVANIATLAKDSQAMIDAMNKNLSPAVATMLGDQLMAALADAIAGGGSDAVANLEAILKQIDDLMNPKKAAAQPAAPKTITASLTNTTRGALYQAGFSGMSGPQFGALSDKEIIATLNAEAKSDAGFAQRFIRDLTKLGGSGMDLLALLRGAGLSFHQGGVVPGPIGAERLVLARGGEQFLGPGAGRGGDIHVHLHIEGPLMGNEIEARRFARQVGDLIRQDWRGQSA